MTVPRSFTAFKDSLHMDDEIVITNYLNPGFSRGATIVSKTLNGLEVTGPAPEHVGHISWPQAVSTLLVENGVELLATHRLTSVDDRGWSTVEVGEPWIRIQKLPE